MREDALKNEVVNLRQELQQQNSQLQKNQQIIIALQVSQLYSLLVSLFHLVSVLLITFTD